MSYLDHVSNESQWLSEIENTVLKSLTTKRTNWKRNTFYPSDALCARKQVLESTYEYDTIAEPMLNYAAQLGNCTETMVIDALLEKFTEKVFAYNLSINSKENGFDSEEWINYSGKIDLILNSSDNDIIICDIKTYGKDLRIEQYTAQLQFYAAVTGARKAAILSFSRNLMINGKFAFDVIDIPVTNQHKINAMTVAFYSQLCTEVNILPSKPKEFRKTVECKYCWFKEKCWNNSIAAEFSNDEHKLLYIKAVKLATEFINKPGRLERFIKSVKKEQ